MSKRNLSIDITIFVVAAFTLASCTATSSPVVTDASGATAIKIQQGVNCYQGKCFSLNRDGSINVTGRHNVNSPVSLAQGTLSPTEFFAVYDRGMRAGTIGGTER